MNEIEVQNILIEILRLALNGETEGISVKEKLTTDVLTSVCRLAKKHDLAHIVAKFVYDNNIETSPELLSKLQKEEVVSVYRCEQLKCAFIEICKALDEAKIAYIPLKGFVIRPYYPYESMRTSCDIDILIHETDLDLAVSKLQSIGYRCEKKNYHDVSLFSPNNIHLELHFNIRENMENLDLVLDDVWQHTYLTKGCRYNLKKEFFAFHIYAHMAYHFISGGCGIRTLMDIWIMEHKMDASYICAKELLKKAGIYTFAEKMSDVANMCFSGKAGDGFSELVLKYIFNGGVYGSTENNIAVEKSKTNSSTVYVLKRIFLPYKSMVLAYPILKKAPYLLPFCWIVRWVKAIFNGKSRKFASKVVCARKISDQKINEIKEIRSRLDL